MITIGVDNINNYENVIGLQDNSFYRILNVLEIEHQFVEVSKCIGKWIYVIHMPLYPRFYLKARDLNFLIPDKVMDDHQAGKCLLVFAYSLENLTTEHFETFNDFVEYNGLNKPYVLLTTASYDTRLFSNAEYKVIGFNPFYKFVNKYIPELSISSKFDRKFLCLNRGMRLHRIILSSYLSEEDSYLSFPEKCKDNYFPERDSKILCDTEFTVYDYFRYVYKKYDLYGAMKYKKRIREFSERVPFILDNLDSTYKGTYYNIDKSLFDKSFMSVVNETSFFKNILPSPMPFITEKTIKCLKLGHPFIIVGDVGSIGRLQELGFKTYGKWIDESYDQEDDDIKRMDLLIEEISRLSSLDDNSLLTMNKEMIYNIEFNKRHLKNIFFDQEDELRDFLENI